MHRLKLGFVLGAPVLGLLVLLVLALVRPPVAEATADELAELAVGYVKTGQEALAASAFERALALEPAHFRAHYGAAHLEMRRKRADAAVMHLKAALAEKPEDVNAMITLGAAYVEQRDFAAAERQFLSVRKVHPSNASAVYNLGMLEIERRRYAPAQAYLKQYVEMAPKAADLKTVRYNIRLLDNYIKDEAGR